MTETGTDLTYATLPQVLRTIPGARATTFRITDKTVA